MDWNQALEGLPPGAQAIFRAQDERIMAMQQAMEAQAQHNAQLQQQQHQAQQQRHEELVRIAAEAGAIAAQRNAAVGAPQVAERAVPPPRHAVLKPPPVGQFTGENLSKHPVEHFLEEVERHFGLLESQGAAALPERAKVQFVLTHLKGAALEWWRAEEADKEERFWMFPELKQALRVKFQEHLVHWGRYSGFMDYVFYHRQNPPRDVRAFRDGFLQRANVLKPRPSTHELAALFALAMPRHIFVGIADAKQDKYWEWDLESISQIALNRSAIREFRPSRVTSGPTPMDINVLTAGEEDYEDEQSEETETDGVYVTSTSYGRSRQPARQGGGSRRALGPFPPPAGTRWPKLTDADRKHLHENKGCLYCRKLHAGHTADNCPLKRERAQQRQRQQGGARPA